jgi:tetratricopeptide (TPR) repeat protein
MQEMLAVAERIRHGTGVGSAHAAIGEIDIKAGRFDEALRAFDAAIAQFERLRDRMRTGQSRLQRAGVLAEVGRTAEARAEWAAGEQLLDDTTSPDVRRLRDGLRERLGEDVPTHPQISGE